MAPRACHYSIRLQYRVFRACPGRGPAGETAILVFDKAENIDFTGPLQVFDDAGFEAFTVAADQKTVVVTARPRRSRWTSPT